MALIDTKDIIGVKEIADIFGVGSSAVSNFQKRYSDFPNPVAVLKSGSVFNRAEIEKWGKKHNRICLKNTTPITSGNYKAIAIVGLPRTGKSYISSVFTADNECFILRRTFSRAGNDFTQCAVKLIVSTKISVPFAQFHCEKEEERRYSKIEEENLTNFVNEINDYIKKERKEGITPAEYIELYLPPSSMAKEIMDKSNLSYLVITDTPGVSDDYKLMQISEAHLVLLVLTDSGDATAKKGFKEIVEKIAPLVATGDACFLYNLKKPCDDEDEYKDVKTEAAKAMQCFEDSFASLRKSIITTSMNILHPSKTVLGVPGFKDKKINCAEEFFRNDFQKTIKNSFEIKETNQWNELNETKKRLNEELLEELATKEKENPSFDIIEYFEKIYDILLKIPRYKKITSTADFLPEFKKEKHDRVKTQDNYRIVNKVYIARQNVLSELYKYFNQYTSENIPDPLTQILLKLFYHFIIQEIKSDFGLATGCHPWEDYPPVTMRAIEYILFPELDKAFNDKKTNESDYITYYTTLQENGITSNSWHFVSVNTENKYMLKILMDSGILSLRSDNLYELVKHRYIGGLRKIGEFRAWANCYTLLSEKFSLPPAFFEFVQRTGI